MARKLFRKLMPSRDKVDAEKGLRWLRPVLNKPYLWHLNRHSVARATAIGFFWSLIPMPGQSLPAVFFTVKARGNVPLALAATWLSNPFTLIPHWWSAYLIGKFVLRSKGLEGVEFTWEYWKDRWHDFHWLLDHFWQFYLPLLVGSAIEGLVAGVLGYLAVDRFWKWHARRKWRQSRARARAAHRGADPVPPAPVA